MGLNMMNGFMRRSWQMELRSYCSNIRLLIGYSDVVFRVYVDVLGPFYILLGSVVDGICKFGVVQCKITSQNRPAGLYMPLRGSPNYVYQLTTTNSLHQTVIQTLAQPLCG